MTLHEIFAGEPVSASTHRLNEIRVFIKRPWRGQECGWDDIILHCAREGVDPVVIARMASWKGEFRDECIESKEALDFYSR